MSYDLSKPIEIAEDIFWVGYVVPNDPFQCHVYLIRNGEESILIDPGSELVLPVVLEKIYAVTPLKNIKYIVMHHQDPDITGCFSLLEKLFPEGERYIVTHWRTQALLKHFGWQTPFYLVEQHNWKLKAGDRELEFIFTPYAHFPGAICTFDPKTRTLFSSDIFGAISDKFFLFAEDTEDYYRGVEFFHKHYMPSKAILQHALREIKSKNPKLIAPQHGSIIKEDLIDKVISRLENLDCGLYLIEAAKEETDIKILAKVESWIKKLFDIIVFSSDFSSVLKAVYRSLGEDFPQLEEISVVGYLNEERMIFRINGGKVNVLKGRYETDKGGSVSKLMIREPLKYSNQKIGDIIFKFSDSGQQVDRKLLHLLISQVKEAIAVSLKKELDFLLLEEETELDPLTGVFNKRFLQSFLSSLIEEGKNFSIAFIDLDDFKLINDKCGHLKGDCVLKELARVLKRNFRKSDCVSRFGGEEFVIVAVGMEGSLLCTKLNKIRERVASSNLCGLRVTFSAGVTEFKEGDTVDSVLSRADSLLYKAKELGKNRVVCGSFFPSEGGLE